MQAVAVISAGVPRVINLLCDRSLELAFDAQVRTIDGNRVHAAARGLGIEKPSAAAPAPATVPEPATAPAVTIPVETPAPPIAREEIGEMRGFEAQLERPGSDDAFPALVPPPQTPAPRRTQYLLLALLVAVLGAAGVFGYLRMQTPAAEAPPPAASAPRAPAPAARPAAASTQTATPPAGSNAAARRRRLLRHRLPLLPLRRLLRGATTAASGAPALPPADSRFDIVVASFRTDARATTVSPTRYRRSAYRFAGASQTGGSRSLRGLSRRERRPRTLSSAYTARASPARKSWRWLDSRNVISKDIDVSLSLRLLAGRLTMDRCPPDRSIRSCRRSSFARRCC